MRAATGPEPIRKALKVDLIDLVEDRHHRLLDDFVLQRRDAQRTLPPVSLRYKDSSRGFCPIRSTVHPIVQIDKSILQSSFILFPPHAIDTRRSLTLECVEAVAEQFDAHMVEQSAEPFLFPFPCCSSHTVQALVPPLPVLCRAHGRPAHALPRLFPSRHRL